MMTHRIRQLRELRHLSQEALGELVKKTKHQISRLELGESKLDIETAKKIAEVLQVSLAEVVGVDEVRGFAEDVTPYSAKPGDRLSALLGPHDHLHVVETNALDKARVFKGDILVINMHADRVKAVTPLDIVLVLYHPRGQPDKAMSLLRQFVPPSLLITNSSTGNLPSIDTADEDAHIVGVMTDTLRSFGLRN